MNLSLIYHYLNSRFLPHLYIFETKGVILSIKSQREHFREGWEVFLPHFKTIYATFRTDVCDTFSRENNND